jgi:hypothetical protein
MPDIFKSMLTVTRNLAALCALVFASCRFVQSHGMMTDEELAELENSMGSDFEKCG